ncbi:ATP-dependent DNA helicase RecG, partial [Streptococcus pyogenes]
DRFGLSQLHQLRGRVGRGHKQSYAILVANPKTDSGKERMQAMTETTDGFVLAEKDLQMRGSGEVFGTRQSGLPEFQVANIIEDFPILEEARRVASQITAEPNWQINPKWRMIAKDMSRPSKLD